MTLDGFVPPVIVIGATVAALVAYRLLRFQIAYAIAFVLFGFVAAIALKSARRQQWDAAAASAATGTKTETARTTVESSR